jgi:hypothetical protein
MAQELGFVKDQYRMLLFALVEPDDRLRDLARQIAAHMSGLEIEFQRDLPQQVQGRTGGPVPVENFVKVGVEAGSEGAGRGGFAGADFTGEQSDAMMIGQELETGLDLMRGLGGEQLFGSGAIAEGCFLKTEEGFEPRATPFSCSRVRPS